MFNQQENVMEHFDQMRGSDHKVSIHLDPEKGYKWKRHMEVAAPMIANLVIPPYHICNILKECTLIYP